jgi:hypothetical protein
MGKPLRICTQVSLDEVAEAEALARATALRPDNVRVRPFLDPRTMLGAAVERLKLWDNGRTLKVTFLDGDAATRQRIAAVAAEWEQHCNLKLAFGVHARADLRITLLGRGYASVVGTDARSTRADLPTMRLGGFGSGTSDREVQRVVLHEFGHALGMIHEHQSPAARIPWDKEKVYAYYAQPPNGWSREMVDRNIFRAYAADTTNFSAFDPESIMLYPVPDELTVGPWKVDWNTRLSAMDKDFMARQYPRGGPGVVALEVGAPPHEADLAVSGEVDAYTFEVPTAGTYLASTEGATDTVLSLLGPTDPSAVLAWDDDRGRGTNARIVRRRGPGRYWLQVRHKEVGGTGSYRVGVKRRRR